VDSFLRYFVLSTPLFGLVLLGYVVARVPGWRADWGRSITKAVYVIALPALLFQMMSKRGDLPPVDARLLIAFFGGCFIVFFLGRVVAARAFAMDGVSQSVFALGGIFSNNVMLGLPLARLTLGEAALPSVALVLVFNALTLWTLVSISVEWARSGSTSWRGLGKTAIGVVTNPLVAAILAGSVVSAAGWRTPAMFESLLTHLAKLAAPGALVALGLGLAEYGIDRRWTQALWICALKLLVLPLIVWMIGWMLHLPLLELQVVVLLSSVAVGINVYVMSVQFECLQGTIASSLLFSTALASITTPLLLAVLTAIAHS
jgi:malonate transporter